MVANRLPMSMIKNSDKDGDITFKPSAGGLVSALKGVSGMEMIWIGWPGAEVRGKEAQRKVTAKLAESKCKPVFLDKRTADKYYSGFCNNVLWPSFHYIPLPVEALRSAETQFLAYERANELFAQAVLDTYEEGDTVWVHDYHLMLLPSLLRAARPNFRIGWFLHTPFPSEETFRAIPARQELLYGVLASDLIGFHTHDYVRHFLGVCTRIVGATCNNMVLNTQGWLATVGAFPIGITPSKFLEALERPAVEDYLQELKSNFEGRKILLGIDRLDYIKGIPHKLYALEAFLEKNPHWRGKVVLLQIAVPSRTDVLQYQNLKKETHRLVGRINGKFGSLAYSPVHYLDREVSFEILCALYRLADVMVISSLRDGMNLVAFEYIVCQQGKAGVLMLSEFAGAAQSLGAGAVEINPYSVYDFADAIKYALSMTPEQRQAYHEYAMKYVTTHTAQYWAQSYMTNLSSCNLNFSIGDINNVDGIGVGPDGKLHSVARIPAKLSVDNLVSSFKRSKHRLIITGLSSLTKHRINEDGRFFDSNMSSASHALVQSIRLLSSDPDTTFLIVTSKPRQACIKLVSRSVPTA